MKRLVICEMSIASYLTFTCNDAYFILIVRCGRTKEIVKSYVKGARHVPLRFPDPVWQGYGAWRDLTNFKDALSFIDR